MGAEFSNLSQNELIQFWVSDTEFTNIVQTVSAWTTSEKLKQVTMLFKRLAFAWSTFNKGIIRSSENVVKFLLWISLATSFWKWFLLVLRPTVEIHLKGIYASVPFDFCQSVCNPDHAPWCSIRGNTVLYEWIGSTPMLMMLTMLMPTHCCGGRKTYCPVSK